MSKKKNKKKDKKKKGIVRKVPVKRTIAVKQSPYRIVVRDWGIDSKKHKSIELNPTSKLEVHIDGSIYRISVNEQNKCLEFDTVENSLYLQPVSYKRFLVKANSKDK